MQYKSTGYRHYYPIEDEENSIRKCNMILQGKIPTEEEAVKNENWDSNKKESDIPDQSESCDSNGEESESYDSNGEESELTDSSIDEGEEKDDFDFLAYEDS